MNIFAHNFDHSTLMLYTGYLSISKALPTEREIYESKNKKQYTKRIQ